MNRILAASAATVVFLTILDVAVPATAKPATADKFDKELTEKVAGQAVLLWAATAMLKLDQ
jgi:hypothetical protein